MFKKREQIEKPEQEEQVMFCGYCGERLPCLGDDQIGHCPTCRRRFGSRRQSRRPPPPPIEYSAERVAVGFPGSGQYRFRDPILAALLSAVLPGAGQIYNLNFFKGLLVCLTCWLIIPYFLGIFDAYITAEKGNRWQTVEVRRCQT